jgi:hypothetical protein
LNIASVWELPVLFVIENNGYGLRLHKWTIPLWKPCWQGKDTEWKAILLMETTY